MPLFCGCALCRSTEVLIGITIFSCVLRSVSVSSDCRSCSVLKLEDEPRLMKLDELANTIIRIKKNIMSLNLKAKIERSMFIVQFIRN